MTLQEFSEYLNTHIVEDKIVYMRYKYSWEDEWTYTNEILEVDMSVEGYYTWVNDWNEGQEEVEILGCISVSDIDVPEFEILGKSILEQEPTTFQWCTDCKEYDQEKHCCHRWSKVIRNTVEEMKQEQEPRWIPVSERLPEWGEEVLTIDNDGNYEINHIIDDDINEWFYDGVVAWMPLPKGYREVKG